MKQIYIGILLLMMSVNSTIAQSANEIPSSARKINPVAVGDTLPVYPLTDTKHNTIQLYDYLKEKPIILIYYRGGW